MRRFFLLVAALVFLGTGPLLASTQVQTDKGLVEGKTSPDGAIREFLGIPYAAPPVGDLRWKPPQPSEPWTGVKKVVEFGHRPMQVKVWDDMIFRDPGPSEDCLTLNIWTPAREVTKKRPVMVWVYGGGYVAGGTSEPRQDGENLSRKDVVVVSFNYRLGIFGFFSHPELTAESEDHASGNYGLLDQVAALRWVKANIAAFGGDPNNVTIFGESAGSFSVSALMASPLAKGLFQKAIGESGALFGRERNPQSLAEAEAEGTKFAEALGARSLSALRAKPAWDLLHAATKPDAFKVQPCVDGYFLATSVQEAFHKGGQNRVPLLAGWNADEGGYKWFLGDENPTPENFLKQLGKQYGNQADTFLKVYPASTVEEVKRAAGDLAGDRFIAYSTWKWIETHLATGHAPIYRYEFDQAPPVKPGEESRGVYHSAEIEYVFNQLKAAKPLPWREEDQKVADLLGNYWSNFAKTGDPNGPGLPSWPRYQAKTGRKVMHLSVEPQVKAEKHRDRYLFWEKLEGVKK